MLFADDLTFAYGSGREAGSGFALRHVTMRVARGGIMGILGPNGSGKTTLLKLLAGTLHPQSGWVLLDGAPVARMARRELARRIAVVPQETQLAFDYSVLEVVLMGRYPHLGAFQLEGPADLAMARASLAATGTAHLETRSFQTLSGGERQRVVIASALAQAADLMLLDEPTASLDLRYQLDVAALLADLNRSHGVSIVVSTHDLNFAATLCRELVLMRDGETLATGAVTDVLTRENVRRLYDVEADVRFHESAGRLSVVPIGRLEP